MLVISYAEMPNTNRGNEGKNKSKLQKTEPLLFYNKRLEMKRHANNLFHRIL